MENTIDHFFSEEDHGQTIEGFGAIIGRTKDGHRLIIADTGVWISDEENILFHYYYVDREDNEVNLTDEEVVCLVSRIVDSSFEVSIETVEKELFPTLRLKQKENNE
jgi:hypothetical protein